MTLLEQFVFVLEQKNLVSPEDVKLLKKQSGSLLKAGQFLLKKGSITEEDLFRVLAEIYGMPYLDKLEIAGIDEIRGLIPLRFLQKYRLVPYRFESGHVYLAVSDPSTLHAIDEARIMLSAFEISVGLSRESEILRALHNHFDEDSRKRGENEISGESDFELLADIEDLDESSDLANQAPIIKLVNVILSNAVSERASDIHIEPQEKEITVRYRIDGMMYKVLSPPKSVQSGILSRIKIMAGMNIAENRLPQDGRIKIRFAGRELDIRVSSLPTAFGERIVMRLLGRTDVSYEIEKIGFPDYVLTELKKLLALPNGIILITGPTGSGKTTTLYAALNSLNDNTRNIITVEDPIEYQIAGISQVQARHKIGLTFAEGLRSILRQDPDVIMVGEIRDEETARVAIQASLTGHLVFSTLHTNDAPSALTRLLDMGIEPYLITSTARGIMAQRLVRKLCDCKRPVGLSPEDLKAAGYRAALPKKKIQIYEPTGCDKCMNTGYRGRIGVYELMVTGPEMREIILKNPSIDELREEAVKRGMQTLREAALEKVLAGETSLEEALRIT